MIASLSVVEGTSATWNEGRLLKMADVVRLTNMHPNSIRRNCEGENPNLPCYRLPSGARRFKLSDVRRFLGENTDNVIGDDDVKQGRCSIPCAAIIRVSSAKQNVAKGDSDKSSLEHQEQRVSAFIKERWGNRAEVTWYKSVGGGMDFNRPALIRLINDIIEGKFRGGFIVAQDFTRIARFAVQLIEHLAKLGGCQILYTMDEDEAEMNGFADSLHSELLAILCHYTARASGAKAKAILSVRVSPETVQEICSMGKAGYSFRYIAQALKDAGKGRGECGREISKRVVERVLKEHGEQLQLLESTTNTTSPALTNSFVEFMQTRVRLTGIDDCRCRQSVLIDRYREWCGQQGKAPMTAVSIRKAMKKHFPTVQQKWTDDACVSYVGMTFITT
jgi:predicted site-specific integrase-resolvase